MTSLVDERGFNQGYALTDAQTRRLSRRADAILAEMGPPFHRPVKILEIGCGTGELASLLARAPGAEVLGLDLSSAFIQRARSLHAAPNLRFETGDILGDLGQLEPQSVDFVVGNGVLHHVHADLDRVLAILRGLLRPGGKLIFWEPNYLNPFVFAIFTFSPLRRWANLEPAEMAFSPGFIARKLRGSGLTGIRIATRDFLLPNTPERLIGVTISLGGIMEKIPLMRAWAQSLFIVAVR